MVEAHRLERGRERIHEEVEVLEGRKKSDVDDQGDRQEHAAPAGVRRTGNRPRTIEVDDRRRADERQETRVPPSVEDVARDEQEHVLAAPSQSPIGEDDSARNTA